MPSQPYKRILQPLFFLSIILLAAMAVQAQTTPSATDAAWQEPLNLSNSGGASQPRFVLDAEGVGHLLWRDQFQGFVYSRSEQPAGGSLESWQTTAGLELPFATRRFFFGLQPTAPTPRFTPHLLADSSGRIHAFWLDNEDSLYHSSVAATDFTDFAAWSNRQQVAEAARAVSATLGPDGRLHLTYVRPLASDAFPAGIYYRQSDDNGSTWSNALPLYDSPYLRGIEAAEAQVEIVAAEGQPAEEEGEQNSTVFIGWTNPQRDRLYLIRSIDGGQNWEPPYLVDNRRPQDGPEAISPTGLQIQAQQDTIMLTWQAGHDGRTCDQQVQWSDDGGDTWSAALPMSEQLGDCPDTYHLLPGPEGSTLLLTHTEGQGSRLLAWDGSRWSDPQLQSALDTFINPDTFRPVALGCYQPLINTDGELLLAGCDTGRSQDIWLLSRPLGDLAAWFPPPPEESAWELPTALERPAVALSGLRLLGDDDGRFHAFWTGADETAVSYARWEGEQWSRPSPVLRSPAAGSVGAPAVASLNARLLAVWPDSDQGELLFSWANAARATAASEWIEPVSLPLPALPRPAVTEASLAVDRSGNIYVAYAIPVNEERGVYLVWSDDAGESWSPPLNLFDGVAAGWLRVGPPQLTVDASGRLYATWTAHDLSGQPLGLYHSRSDDGGLSWAEETAVVSGAVVWQQTVAVGERTIHQLWAGPGEAAGASAQAALWHRFSPDNGQSWSRAARVAGLGANPLGPPALALDRAGRLHLVQAAAIPAEASAEASAEATAGEPLPLRLHQWLWQEERWQAEPVLDLGRGLVGGFSAPAAAAASGDRLGFVYLAALSALNGESDLTEAAQAVAFSQRPLALPAVSPTPLPTLPPTATPLPQPTATPLPQPTATVFFPTEVQTAPGFSLPLPDDRLAGPIAGLIPAALLIIIALAIGLYTMRRR